MKDTSVDYTVIETLETALANDSLPTAARDYAKHLLKRLASPVRVSVMGVPHSGKSELINMFLGRRVLPKDARLPTTEVVYGETGGMTVTRADGTRESFDKLDLAKVSGKNAAFLRLEVPAPILQRISLLEVVTDGTALELASAIDWSVRRTDIAIWCSQDFDEAEQVVWRRVPDSLKDHAFLVLTKADVLSEQKVLSKRVASLETIVAEEFHSLFAVATLKALKAHQGGGAVDEAMHHASGGGAVTAEILRHAERGRRADFDGAHLFLARYKIDLQPSGKRQKTPKAQPVEATAPMPEPAPVAAVVPAAAEAFAEKAVEAPAPKVVSRPAPKAAPKKAFEVEFDGRAENVALLSDAVRFLKRRGENLTEAAQGLGEGDAKGLIDQCVNAVEYLVDLFSQDDSGCPVSDAFIDELAEAADMMVLMQVEEGDAPAADAATLLLQLRRDMEMKLAA